MMLWGTPSSSSMIATLGGLGPPLPQTVIGFNAGDDIPYTIAYRYSERGWRGWKVEGGLWKEGAQDHSKEKNTISYSCIRARYLALCFKIMAKCCISFVAKYGEQREGFPFRRQSRRSGRALSRSAPTFRPTGSHQRGSPGEEPRSSPRLSVFGRPILVREGVYLSDAH